MLSFPCPWMCSRGTKWGHLEARKAPAEAGTGYWAALPRTSPGDHGRHRRPQTWGICAEWWCGHRHETAFNTQLGVKKMALLLLPSLNILALILGCALAAPVCSWGRHSAKAGVELSLGSISSAWPVSLPALDRTASRNPAFLLTLAPESGSGNWNLLYCRRRARQEGSPGTAGGGCSAAPAWASNAAG